jgi:hypothetical protein
MILEWNLELFLDMTKPVYMYMYNQIHFPELALS